MYVPDKFAKIFSPYLARAIRQVVCLFMIDELIEARAWNDAALTLVELELPAWKQRRLIYEDGKWHCSLSRHPNLPVALDDTATASHEVLPLAYWLRLLKQTAG